MPRAPDYQGNCWNIRLRPGVKIAWMESAPIQLDQIWKSYGSTTAVRGLSLLVPARSVFGFLGPNGAGKSTTIRLILGLQRPDRGAIRLFGKPVEADVLGPLARVGSLVESPSLYLHLTGRENLEVHRRLLSAPVRVIDEALDAVRLTDAADRFVRGYSSGMKQRLGLAQALLGRPELLILDEPTNGLDPAGIHEVRALIRELPDRSGATVFLSSHLLSEVEQMATHLAIISAGQTRFQGTLNELQTLSRSSIVVEVDDENRAISLMRHHGVTVTGGPTGLIVADPNGLSAADINTMLVRSGIAVSGISTRRPTLEEVFLGLTEQTDSREPAVA